MNLIRHIVSSFAFFVVPNFLFSILFTYIFCIVFFLYKTVRKIRVLNISIFLLVNVKRKTEDSELILNTHTHTITEVNLLLTYPQVQSCFIAGFLKYLKLSASFFCFLLQVTGT